jgi:hypothetical protein
MIFMILASIGPGAFNEESSPYAIPITIALVAIALILLTSSEGDD